MGDYYGLENLTNKLASVNIEVPGKSPKRAVTDELGMQRRILAGEVGLVDTSGRLDQLGKLRHMMTKASSKVW